MPIHMSPKMLNEEDIDVVIEKINNNKDFEKSVTKIKVYESIKKLKYPQEYEDGFITRLDNLIERKMNDPRVQAMGK